MPSSVFTAGSLLARRSLAARAHSPTCALLLLGALFSSGCYFSDQELPPAAGDACTMEGATQGALVCRQGSWSPTTTTPGTGDMSDMGGGVLDMSSPQDMDPSQDMGDLGGCIPETTEEICRTLGRCGVTLSISDRCDMVRNVECPRSVCPTDMLCNEAGGICEPLCEPDPCPTTLTCGLAPDGCGKMQVCDQCGEGTVCDADASMCTCSEEAVSAALCEGRCGSVSNTLSDTCFADRMQWACSSCETGGCNMPSNSCVMLEPLPRDTTLAGERFGASLSLDGDYLMVGAPGEQTNYLGNVYIHHLESGSRVLDVRQTIDLGTNYEGYVLGTSVAMNKSTLALPGKTKPARGSMSSNASLSLLVNIEDSWQRSTTLDGTHESAGTTVATARNYFAVGAPGGGGDSGEVTLFTLNTSSQSITYSRVFKGSSEGRLGSAMAMTDTQLLIGAPGARAGRGECRLARVQSNLIEWDNPDTLPAEDGESLEGMCRTLALRPNLAAVGARRLLPSSTRGVDIVHLYDSRDNGASWSFVQEIENPGARDDGSFGQAIALSQDKTLLLVGDPLLDALDGTPEAGAVHIYRRSMTSGLFELIDTLRSNTPQARGHFGQALALSLKQVYVGAPDERVMNHDAAGVVYIHALP